MITGSVKSFNLKRRYGFIQPDNGGKDIFVHISEVHRSGLPGLRRGQRISFEVMESEGREVAGNLRALNDAVQDMLPLPDMLPQKSAEQPPMIRKPIARDALEQAITEAVKGGGPQYEEFVGVLVERMTPELEQGANWMLKAVKFGKAERSRCSEALLEIVEQLQNEYKVTDW